MKKNTENKNEKKTKLKKSKKLKKKEKKQIKKSKRQICLQKRQFFVQKPKKNWKLQKMEQHFKINFGKKTVSCVYRIVRE